MEVQLLVVRFDELAIVECTLHYSTTVLKLHYKAKACKEIELVEM